MLFTARVQRGAILWYGISEADEATMAAERTRRAGLDGLSASEFHSLAAETLHHPIEGCIKNAGDILDLTFGQGQRWR